MKLIYYGVSEEEEPFIQRWSFLHKIPVTIRKEQISKETIEYAKGHDGICLYPSVDMRENETFYRMLSNYGMKQLSIKSTGIDGVNLEWAKKYHLQVTNVPAYSPTSVGHFAVMAILMLARNIPMRMHTDDQLVRKTAIGDEIQDIKVGIIGTGRIGKVVAQTIVAMGGTVLAYSRTQDKGLASLVSYLSLEDVVSQADILSIHIPLTKESVHLFDDELFAKMKPTGKIVNTARGKIIDTKALIRWLEHSEGGCMLDTLEDEEKYFQVGQEQNPFYQDLMAYPNVFITPHIAYYTQLAVKEIAETALNNARDILESGASMNTISL